MVQNRPPIIVILGHVDHGKTTLLDFLRQSNIAAHEAGGITQHIRSFQFNPSPLGLNTPMTFIDTPGHAAFSSLRLRGSQLADIAILVIAADDGVKPQTQESIQFITSHNLPFIVAITKIDLPTADPDRVKSQLTEFQVVVEDLGGSVPALTVSAKTGQGITDLVEMLQLISSLNPPQADPEGPLQLLVLESRLDSKKGPLAVCVVKNGTLRPGQQLYQSSQIGKARAIAGSGGQPLTTALPSTPIEVLGLSLVPEVGSVILDRPFATAPAMKPLSGETTKSDTKFNLIIKADFAGSLEAILANLSPEFNVISSGSGDITENDILLAVPAKAHVIGFNVRVSSSIVKLAETESVPLRVFTIIYQLFEYLDTLLHPVATITVVGRAEILADFKINSERIAGCRCIEGVVNRSAHIRIERAGREVGTSRVKSLRLGKSDAPSVKSSQEFGAVFSPYIDFRVGDNIIATTG